MIPNRERNQVTSTLQGEDVKMSLSADATAHIMSMMTEQYSDPIMAALREYVTNARDSHTAAGVSEPIEVELPTQLRPALVIRDRGLGLSADDVRSIYSQYGASTKRDSDDFNGMLGIGCKAALAYTDQFTLTARKRVPVEGPRERDASKPVTCQLETVVAVSRDEDGGGTMKIIAESPTDAGNGVEVTIPTKRGDDSAFGDRAAKLFAFWPEGSVLVDGEAPDAYPDGLPVTDELTLYNSRTERKSYVVMGGVPYPVTDDAKRDAEFPVGVSFVARVAIGAVDFPPSREALTYTPRTTATLNRLGQAFVNGRAEALGRWVSEADTRSEAMERFIAGRFLAGGDTVQYRGQDIPMTLHGDFWRIAGDRYGSSYNRGGGEHVRTTKIDIEQLAQAPVFVTDFDNDNWSSQMRLKLDAYLADRFTDEDGTAKVEAYRAILTPESTPPEPEWIAHKPSVSWADVRKFKLDPQAPRYGGNPAARVSGTYYTYLPNETQNEKMPAADLVTLAKNGFVYYVEARKYTASRMAQQLRAVHPGAYLIECPSTRASKLVRDVKPKPALAAIQKGAAKWRKGISMADRELMLLAGQRTSAFTLSALEPAEVDDPELRDFLIAEDCAAADRITDLRATKNLLAPVIGGEPGSAEPKGVWLRRARELEVRYPLVPACASRYNRDSAPISELTFYVNSKFNAGQEA